MKTKSNWYRNHS